MAESMREIMNPGAAQREPGFPNAPDDWSPDQAATVAAQEGIELTEDHWETIRALQSYFAHNEQRNVRALHDALDERFHSKGGIRFLYEILPGGPVAQGCRLAGLNAPAGASDTSFGSVQ